MKYEYLIALDPSLTCTGVSIFSIDGKLMHTDKVKTSPTSPMSERYMAIVQMLQVWLDQFPNSVLVSESQYLGGGRMFKAMLITPTIKGLLTGAYMVNCLRKGIEPKTLEVGTSQAKKKLGIKGSHKRKENKAVIREKIQELYPKLRIKNQDEIDSIMLGIAGVMLWEELCKSAK